jgi:hypothetical protein
MGAILGLDLAAADTSSSPPRLIPRVMLTSQNRRLILNLNRYLAQRALKYQYYYGACLISIQESPTYLLYAVLAQTRSLGPHRPKHDLELALIDHDTTKE